MTDREFLRLHIEACWRIEAPPIEGSEVALAAQSALPPWSLYLAQLGDDSVTLWRPGMTAERRAALLARAQQALNTSEPTPGMRRELALRAPSADAGASEPRGAAGTTVRTLTANDATLLEAFEAGSASYYLSAACSPCVGVIVAGALVSVAHSSRRTLAVCELGIDTVASARRRGYGSVATIAWTRAIQREGLTPIYSAADYNLASLRTAAAAGYTRVVTGIYDAGDEAPK